ncbi:protein-disulfide isomerase [Erythrobacteraceae bacterium CFH 75059]|uniref:DsbA family protein n=1 Tax=Qipengyuania thermophila TaxID=2509361 RepID=UPI00101EF013|nr:thioredoxin domain-containing protein [Qipengyuania thermophila]TCD04879.1 protein-disulfide isomerase [Erythrobacteraceae bacterium CFH 75059]
MTTRLAGGARTRRALPAFTLPLALLAAGCGSGGSPSAGALEGDPVAAVAPPAGQSWTDVVQTTPEGGFLIGNPQAPIQVVEYLSLTCPACAQFNQTGTPELKERYVSTGRVSLEMRNQIHGPHDLVLARLVRCGPEGTGAALSEQVLANQQALLEPVFANQAAFEQALALPEQQRFVRAAEVAGFFDFFAARGLGEQQARQCLADSASLERLAQQSQTQSEQLDIRGTPSFLVNGQKVEASTWAQLEPVLQRAGAR